jgi:hypothetical protein
LLLLPVTSGYLITGMHAETAMIPNRAAGAEPPALAGKGRKKLMLAVGVGAAHPGESFVQATTSQVFLDHLIYNRPEKPVLLLAILVKPDLKSP